MDLILWRHAEAANGLTDEDRTLTDRGREQAERVAGWLRSRLPKEYTLLCSPATRARQTASSLRADPKVEEALSGGSSVERILDAASWPHDDGAVVVVGHQPFMGRTAAALMTGMESGWGFGKGCAWWFRSRETGGGIDTVLRVVVDPELI